MNELNQPSTIINNDILKLAHAAFLTQISTQTTYVTTAVF